MQKHAQAILSNRRGRVQGKHLKNQRLAVVLGVLLVTAAMVGLSSCAGVTSASNGQPGQPGNPGSGTLTAGANSLSFGNVPVGSATTQNLTVTNVGTAAVNISQVTIAGAGFTVLSGSLNGSIGAGQNASYQIQLAPQSAGAVSGSFSIISDASNSPLAVGLSGTGTQAGLAISPATVAFGNVTVGQSSTQSVQLTNTGNTSLTVSGATVAGSGFSVNGLSLPATIGAGLSVSFNVQFQPAAAGGVTGSVTFTDNAPGSPQSLPLSGAGIAANSTLIANPASFAFGNVTVGSNSSQAITLTNTGNTSITISQASITGAGFSISGISAPVTLTPGQATSLTAQFAPTAAGAASGTITITSNASNPTLTIALSGTGTQGILTASPASVNFGTLALNSSASTPVTLTNTGTANLTINSDSVSGTGFSISGLATPVTLTPGQTASVTATFSPTTAGSFSGSISIADNLPSSPLSISLSGTGAQGFLSPTPGSVNFGNVTTGSSNSQAVSLKNTGSVSLTITQASVTGAGFSMTGLSTPLTLAANQTASFNAVFAPTTAGAASGSISLTSNASNSPLAISLSGTGVQATQLLSANPTSVSFGNVNDGTSATQNVTLTNNGNSNVTISSVTATGAGISASGVSNGLVLAPNQTANLSVQFAPTAPGAVTGSVTVASNATNSPATVSVTGTGVAATNHTVSLNWTASGSSGVVGYNVYRGTSSNALSKITSSLVGGTNYTDSTVTSGQNITYFYAVTAVNSSNEESTDSNVASALVP